MDFVEFQLVNGKVRRLKREMAEHLARAGKGRVLGIRASDAVKEQAKADGIDLQDVAGTGKDGRILKRDLQTYQTRMLKAR